MVASKNSVSKMSSSLSPDLKKRLSWDTRFTRVRQMDWGTNRKLSQDNAHAQRHKNYLHSLHSAVSYKTLQQKIWHFNRRVVWGIMLTLHFTKVQESWKTKRGHIEDRERKSRCSHFSSPNTDQRERTWFWAQAEILRLSRKIIFYSVNRFSTVQFSITLRNKSQSEMQFFWSKKLISQHVHI